MKFFNILVAFITGSGLAIAAPSVPASDISSDTSDIIVAGNRTYNIVSLEWEIQINNTASPYNISVNGTKQDVLKAISRVDAAAAANITANIASINNTLQNSANASKSELVGDLEARYVPTDVHCNVPGWTRCSVHRVYQGIAYLNGLPGTPANGPGPGTCGRVSCSYSAAIYWCNDNDFAKTIDGFHNIGDGAQLIVDSCNTNDKQLQGQQFFSDGWNVIVRWDSC